MASSKVQSGSVKVTAVVAVGKPCGGLNHSETLVRANKGTYSNHSETLVRRPVQGQPYYVPLRPWRNHSETLVRRPADAVVAVGRPCGMSNHSETLVRG